MQRARPVQPRNKSAFLAMLVACSVVFLTALDQTVVVTALPKIITDLSITVQQLDRAAWIVSGYLLGFIIAMPLMGRISDMYGRRSVFLICLGIFALGSLVCGLAPNLGDTIDISFLQHIGINVSALGDLSDPTALSPRLIWLVAARFVQAIGGGATIPVAMAVAGDFYGEKQRGLALGLIGMVTETGGVLGPLWGAVITQTLGWQAIFFINIPIVVLLALLIWRFIPSNASSSAFSSESAPVPAPAPSRRMRIDFTGALLLGASLFCLSLGLSQEAITAAPGATPGTSQSPIQNNPWLIGASLLLLAGFVILELFLERRRSPSPEYAAGEAESRPRRGILPVIEMTVFRRAAFSATSLVSLLVGSALIIAMVDIPFFIDTVLNGTALDSGLALLRLTALIPVGAILGGLLCPRITCRVTAVIGLLLTALGFLLMHLWPLDVNWLQITSSTVIGGLGFGLVIAPIGTTAINAASSRQLGMASSVITVLRMVGMIVGLAALTSWGLGRFQATMSAFKPPAGVTPFSAPYLAALGKYATLAGHDVYTSIFLAAGIICLVAIVPALLLEGKKPSSYAIPGTV
ncbi:MAG TPA: MFS transporter [Ktedonobacteraceae bacterium]